jgi:hypothetical protein
MMTIFCDFCQFSAKKLAFFSKTNVMITIFAKTSISLSKKNAKIFAKFFGENILKIITSVPGLLLLDRGHPVLLHRRARILRQHQLCVRPAAKR